MKLTLKIRKFSASLPISGLQTIHNVVYFPIGKARVFNKCLE